jgi:hypothetical protein
MAVSKEMDVNYDEMRLIFGTKELSKKYDDSTIKDMGIS